MESLRSKTHRSGIAYPYFWLLDIYYDGRVIRCDVIHIHDVISSVAIGIYQPMVYTQNSSNAKE